MGTSFVLNAANLLVFLFLILAQVVLIVLLSLCGTYCNLITRLNEWIIKRIFWSGFILFLIEAALEFWICAFIQFKTIGSPMN